jgi:molybdopterin converting factor small subunit
MSIAVVLPRALTPYARGSSTVVVTDRCASVADALSAVGKQWPGVLDRVMTERGEVREHVNIFVGEESIRFANGLATEVGDGDTIMIVAAVSGG